MQKNWVSVIHTVVVALLLLSALAAVHFLGFLRSMPEGIQRLVATSFAVEFSATFLYYASLAVLGARMGTYASAAFLSSWTYWLQLLRVRKSPARLFAYLRGAKKAAPLLGWPVLALTPAMFAILYADVREAAYALAGVSLTLVMLTPIALPMLTLSPSRFLDGLKKDETAVVRWRSRSDLLLLLAVVFLALSYFLGKARFSHLVS